MHVIINTITAAALLELFGIKGMAVSRGYISWAKILAIYYALAAFLLAVTKTYFIIVTRKPDKEFEETFLAEK